MALNEITLRKMLSKNYKYRDLTIREITNVTDQYKDLKPLFDNYVFNDGSNRELLSLTGTVPVSFKGNVYNIPICLWLLDTYPFNPPICFVKPTSAMMIKTGKHVDANGKIYLPYLHEWKHPESDLFGLIQVMIVVFGEEPPVFARPTTQTAYPGFQPSGPPTVIYWSTIHWSKSNSHIHQPRTCQIHRTLNLARVTLLTLGKKSLKFVSLAHMIKSLFYNLLFNVSVRGFQGYPYPAASSGYPATSGTPHYTPTTAGGPSRDATIGEDTIRASLVSAVSDKLRWRMKEEMDRAQAELDALKRTEEDLKKGHQKLEEMVSKVDQEITDVDRNIELLKKKDEELTAALEKMEQQSENNDIDELIVPTAPLYRQILNLYAEENAIEDTIFYLGEALRRDVIDLDVFLKHVRLLSRKQFQLRALMQKARKTAGLSDLY
ncbi:hypothetical protein QTP70_026764 [Hemibagrus guttatus]|uniref:Tumor susceptibility 101a n=1 Tax=Hemibagrus guttatus TaxID=175788 RepID=A0AAE0PYL1_9TELE|nr:hypothetical protein QTP70_026764 [Hemibagrus guttatus]